MAYSYFSGPDGKVTRQPRGRGEYLDLLEDSLHAIRVRLRLEEPKSAGSETFLTKKINRTLRQIKRIKENGGYNLVLVLPREE